MAKKIDIGVNNVARNVKNAYIGVDGKARKIKAGWIGVGGVARQFYASEQLIPFTSSVVPESWTAVTTGTDYTSTNDYGTWEIKADNYYTTNSRIVSNAFDTSITTYYRTLSKTSDTEVSYMYLICPLGISIKPEEMSIAHYYCGSTNYPSIVQASKDNSNWVNLAQLSRYSSRSTEQFDLSVDEYYRYFRIKFYRYSSSYASSYINDFKITNGTLKIE